MDHAHRECTIHYHRPHLLHWLVERYVMVDGKGEELKHAVVRNAAAVIGHAPGGPFSNAMLREYERSGRLIRIICTLVRHPEPSHVTLSLANTGNVWKFWVGLGGPRETYAGRGALK